MIIILFFLIIASMILSFIFYPKINILGKVFNTHWIIVTLGAILFIILGLVDGHMLKRIVVSDNAMNPAKLIILFISMTIMSLYLNEVGFFEWLALAIVKHVKPNQTFVFSAFYVIISVMTIFVSNDVIILTLTPLVIYFTKNAKISPIPYLFAVIVAGNTFSNVLLTGNPTNIYLAAQQYIDFVDFAKVMLIPGLLSGMSGYFLLRIVFHKSLKMPMVPYDITVTKIDRTLAFIGVFHLLSCIILLALAHVIQMDMWLITLLFLISLIVSVAIYSLKKKEAGIKIKNAIKKAPWSFMPLIVGMYILIEGLSKTLISQDLGQVLNRFDPIFGYGVMSFISANVMNNIPMSMFFAKVIESTLLGANAIKATYATIIGANLGVLLTPFGALAGLMWFELLKQHKIVFNLKIYVKSLGLISIAILAITLLALYLIL